MPLKFFKVGLLVVTVMWFVLALGACGNPTDAEVGRAASALERRADKVYNAILKCETDNGRFRVSVDDLAYTINYHVEEAIYKEMDTAVSNREMMGVFKKGHDVLDDYEKQLERKIKDEKCAADIFKPIPTPHPTRTPLPTVQKRDHNLRKEDCSLERLTQAQPAIQGLAMEAYDGDTLIMMIGTPRERVLVNLWGIDAPDPPSQEGSGLSKRHLERILSQVTQVRVRVVEHPEEGTGEGTDDGRMEAIVEGPDQWSINAMMVFNGQAYHDQEAAPNNICLREAQAKAVSDEAGLWAYRPGGTERPWDYRERMRR